MSTESHVQLQTEGSGPEVRTLEVGTYELASDGTPTAQDVHQQVVTLADRMGRFIENDDDWREAVLFNLKQMNVLLEVIADALGPH